MDRRVVYCLAGCFGVLVIGVILIGMLASGLGTEVKAVGAAELENFDSAVAQFEANQQAVEKAMSDDPTLFESEDMGVRWKDRFAAAASELEKVSSSRTKLAQMLEEDDRGQREEVNAEIQTLNLARSRASAEAAEMRAAVDKLLNFKQELVTKLPTLESDLQAIQSTDLKPVEVTINKAGLDWPEKDTELKRHMYLYAIAKKDAEHLWNSSQESLGRARAGSASGKDVVQLIGLATRLHDMRQSLAGADKATRELVDQLYWSWDKILTDMEIQEGELVTFRQQFQTTRIRAVMREEGQAEEGDPVEVVQDVPVWQTVDKSTYESMKEKLGMTVQHKPAGKFDREATSLIQPAGYAQICSVEERRNHYGYWRPYGGYYHWYYYRPYYPMRRWLWGNDYTPVSSRMYNDYDVAQRSGRTYYGKDATGAALYGSNGTVTKQKYRTSKYVSTSGFKSTNYVKTGGTYRGSRYAQRTSSTSSRTSSSRTSSSRTSSYRSSSSRSSGSRSSFGGK